MSLERLAVGNIRNIKSTEIQLHENLNIFVGGNGSGKTSLLESVYFLGSGRSFRTSKIKPLISDSKEDCTVFGVVAHGEVQTQLGVYRNLDGRRVIKINGSRELRTSELARELPTLHLGPETVELISGPPNKRRSFLNWGVFHVEPGFADTWVDANRCLKQRNQLLRYPGLVSDELLTWTHELSVVCKKIDDYRQAYIEQFTTVFVRILGALSDLQDVKCLYHRGWERDNELGSVYEKQLELDLKRGYTHSGFHKADIKLTVGGQTVSSVCSRGELKVIAWALLLSQGCLQLSRQNRSLVYLVDDLASELDVHHRVKICELLLESKGQVLATAIDGESLRACWGRASRKVFHVEQGTFAKEENECE